MLSSPVTILKTVRREIISFTGLHHSRVRLSLVPFLSFDWFPQSVAIFPTKIWVRRSSSTDNTALGAMGAEPVQQLCELHFGIEVRTAGALDEIGTDIIAIDDNSLTNTNAHMFLLQKVLTAINGLYIKDSSTGRMITHGSIATVSIDPLGRYTQMDEKSKGKGINKYMVSSVVNCYAVFQPMTYPNDIARVVTSA